MATIGRERNTKETAYVSDLYHGPKGRDKKRGGESGEIKGMDKEGRGQ